MDMSGRRNVPRLSSVACVFSMLLGVPASANINTNTPVRTIIFPQADSPVQIKSCSVVANDISNSVPAYAYTQVQSAVAFENTKETSATIARIGFEVEDSFNHAYGTFFGTANGTFSPGVLIEPHRGGILNVLQPDATAWTMNVNGPDIGVVVCYVNAVRFSDGSTWTGDLKAEIERLKNVHAAPSPSSSHSPPPSYHLNNDAVPLPSSSLSPPPIYPP